MLAHTFFFFSSFPNISRSRSEWTQPKYFGSQIFLVLVTALVFFFRLFAIFFCPFAFCSDFFPINSPIFLSISFTQAQALFACSHYISSRRINKVGKQRYCSDGDVVVVAARFTTTYFFVFVFCLSICVCVYKNGGRTKHHKNERKKDRIVNRRKKNLQNKTLMQALKMRTKTGKQWKMLQIRINTVFAFDEFFFFHFHFSFCLLWSLFFFAVWMICINDNCSGTRLAFTFPWNRYVRNRDKNAYSVFKAFAEKLARFVRENSRVKWTKRKIE